MQLSLVAYYGEKPEPLARLIMHLQQQLSVHLGNAFRPYTLAQVHGTILGMEGEIGEGGVYSRWYLENTGRQRAIDFKSLIAFLQQDLPGLTVQIGGYREQENYGFASRGQHPFLRSFSIQGQIAVAMGWPVQSTSDKPEYPKALYELRQDFERFNLCHKWHKDGYQDNDFFFVLGKTDQSASTTTALEQLCAELRLWMSENALSIELDQDVLSLVAYEHTELPVGETTVLPLRVLSEAELMAIYH